MSPERRKEIKKLKDDDLQTEKRKKQKIIYDELTLDTRKLIKSS